MVMFTMQNMSNKISFQLMVERISLFFNCRKSWLGYLQNWKLNRIPAHCSAVPDHFNGLYVNFSCMTCSATFTKTKPNPGEKMASKLISMFLRFTFSMLLARLACVYLNRNNQSKAARRSLCHRLTKTRAKFRNSPGKELLDLDFGEENFFGWFSQFCFQFCQLLTFNTNILSFVSFN